MESAVMERGAITASSLARLEKSLIVADDAPLDMRTTMHLPLSQYGDLLTVDNVAEVLDVSTRTVYRLTDRGELPSVKVGRRLYFPKHLLVETLCL